MKDAGPKITQADISFYPDPDLKMNLDVHNIMSLREQGYTVSVVHSPGGPEAGPSEFHIQKSLPTGIISFVVVRILLRNGDAQFYLKDRASLGGTPFVQFQEAVFGSRNTRIEPNGDRRSRAIEELRARIRECAGERMDTNS